MSFYNRFRHEVTVGGAVGTEPAAEVSTSRAVVAGLVITGLLVWLGFTNPWTLLFVVGLLISILLHAAREFFRRKI